MRLRAVDWLQESQRIAMNTTWWFCCVGVHIYRYTLNMELDGMVMYGPLEDYFPSQTEGFPLPCCTHVLVGVFFRCTQHCMCFSCHDLPMVCVDSWRPGVSRMLPKGRLSSISISIKLLTLLASGKCRISTPKFAGRFREELFFPTSLCGVLVFWLASRPHPPVLPSSSPPPPSLTHSHSLTHSLTHSSHHSLTH